jgi:hypothetical protein
MNGDYDLEKRRLEYSARINPGNAERRMENEEMPGAATFRLS